MSHNRIAFTSPNLNVMARAATKAAKGLVRDFGELENLQVSKKGPGNFVSAADFRSEKIIRETLETARPDYSFLMEESGLIEGKDSDYRWVIDPLDGTTNFLHSIPHFAISIALEYRGDPVAGLIYDPVKDEMFYAETGKGAFCNDRRIRVSERQQLQDALLGMGFPHSDSRNTEQFFSLFHRFNPLVAAIRRSGSAALDLAYVASGRLDAYFAASLNPWDMAAGRLIIKEAGGFTSSLLGRELTGKTSHVLAGNLNIQQKLIKFMTANYKDN